MDTTRELTADTVALVAARLTECAVRLKTVPDLSGTRNEEAVVLHLFKTFLAELAGRKGHAATLEQLIQPD